DIVDEFLTVILEGFDGSKLTWRAPRGGVCCGEFQTVFVSSSGTGDVPAPPPMVESVGECKSCGVSTPCCDPVRSVLHLSFTGPMASLGTVTLNYNPAGSAGAGWYGSASGCGGTVNFEFLCIAGAPPAFSLNVFGAANWLSGGTQVSCPPFHWTGA